jgi:hypothetical protein
MTEPDCANCAIDWYARTKDLFQPVRRTRLLNGLEPPAWQPFALRRALDTVLMQPLR